MEEQIHFIGPGKLGTSFARALFEAGWHIPCFWTKRDVHPDNAEIYLPETIFENLNHFDNLKSAEIIIITVPDNEIRSVAESISLLNFDLSNKLVIHTSGSLNKDELVSLKNSGAEIGSIHPMQSFNARFLPANLFENIYFTVEGNERIIRFTQAICNRLNTKMISITSDQKLIYHIAAVCASNLFVGLLHYSEYFLDEINIEEAEARKILYPIVKSTLENYKSSGSKSSLTGPLSRGDEKVIAKQLSILDKKYKDRYPVYEEISAYIFKFMIDNKSNNYKLLEKLFSKQND